MSKPLRSKLFLLFLPLLACSATPSAPPPSAQPAEPVTIAPPSPAQGEQADGEQAPSAQKTIKDSAPTEKKMTEAEALTALVEMTTREMEKKWCTSPPKAECEAIKAFADAGVPARPKSATFTVGTAVGTTGSFEILRFAPEGDALPRVASSILRPDDASEEAEAINYINSIARGKRDLKSPLHAFLARPTKNELFLTTREAERGLLLEGRMGPGGTGLQLLRQKERNLYLLSITIDSHPRSHEQLIIFPVP